MSITELSAQLSPNFHHATDWYVDHDEEPDLVADPDGYSVKAEAAARAAGNIKVKAEDMRLLGLIKRGQLGTRPWPVKRGR